MMDELTCTEYEYSPSNRSGSSEGYIRAYIRTYRQTTVIILF
jgi:hypothetical protein